MRAPGILALGIMSSLTSCKVRSYPIKSQDASLLPNALALVPLVNTCAELKDVNQGQELHAEIARRGLLDRSDVYAGNSLVNMYIKCGVLSRAREVFNNLCVRDVVSWTTIIGGYVTHGFGMEALKLFEHMQHEEKSPNHVTYICTLKACSSIGCGGIGKELHDKIEREGILRKGTAVGNALVDMYVKCGLFAEGQKVFDKLMVHDRISWSALIMGYNNCEEGAAAWQCFRQMQLEGILPDLVALICSLKSSGLTQNANIVQGLHSVIASLGLLERYPAIGNALIDAYIHCGSLQVAQKLFRKLPVLDIVSWNTLVDGYVRQDCGKAALSWTDRMQLEGMYPDNFTWACCLKACGIEKALQKGKKVHAMLELSGDMQLVVGNALIDMYAKCGVIKNANEVLGKLKVRDVVSWTALIAGFVNHQSAGEALRCFQLMQADHVSPNAATFACILKACGLLKDTIKGIEIHSEIERRGLLGKDIVVGNALLDMYNKCGMLKEALEVFDRVQIKDEASWNALMAVYANHGLGKEALDCVTYMRLEGVYPNSISFMCSLKACGCLGTVIDGIELHSEIARIGLLKEGNVGNALVDMYINCGLLTRAKDVFHDLPCQDMLSWTSVITGFVQHECGKEALHCFDEMQLKGLSPDAAAYVCSLKACKIVGAISKGREIHAEIARCGLLDEDVVVGNSLIEMYATCGWLTTALETFDELQHQDTVSWTALIAGYVQLGELENAFHAFQEMKHEGKSPDAVTFLWVLIGCANARDVEMGQKHFKAMVEVYGINPNIQHYTCIVDLFCRAGLIGRATAFIRKLSLEPDPVVWYILLDACQKFGNVEACRKAFENTVGLDAKDASAHVRMGNLYPGLELGEAGSLSQQEDVLPGDW